MMRRSLFFAFVAIMLAPLAARAATSTLTPVSYVITVTKIELYNSTTSEWIVIKEGASTFDIASVNSGQAIGPYISGMSSLPSGTYTQMRCTISRDIQIKAYNGTHYTTSSQVAFPGATNGQAIVIAAGATPAASAQLGTMHSPDEADDSAPAGMVYQLTDASSFQQTWTSAIFSPFTYTQGAAKSFRLDFDVTNKVIFDDAALTCITDAPVITVTVN